ncbi:probable palmitoyltransferase ZDHHC24 [Maniola jurtina]|uniref:probable palmitoyltransferase ZDHHC24 n=1 Tax=Maniola jurtina TaxID=191418 RepID=UPI001E686E67|nr:probable palmitoyltransferase ZDHHC24 [Maniola jurtina]
MNTKEIAKALRRNISGIVIWEKILCYNLVLLITPCYFIFEMSVVRPTIVAKYNMGALKHTLHMICSTFCFLNVVGNMIYSIVIDTKVKITVESNSYCKICKIRRPEKAWHCKTCNVCILKRDHHCFFFSRCIGLRNQRYYVLYLGYVFISMIYSLYYNYYYVVTKFEEDDMVLSAYRVINPFLRYLIPEPMGIKDLYMFFLFLNTGLVIWSGGLFYFHMMNVLNGLTAHEFKKDFSVDWEMKKNNFLSVFGVKWYWAVIMPFAESPLPQDVDMKCQ